MAGKRTPPKAKKIKVEKLPGKDKQLSDEQLKNISGGRLPPIDCWKK